MRDIGGAAVDRLLLPLAGTGKELIRSGPSSRRAVALSFDDGPSRHNTPILLDLLEQHDARCTFFVVGELIAGSEGLLRRVVDMGHEVGNHTFSHPYTVRLRRGELLDEIERTNVAIEAAGARPGLVRPPFGKDRHRFVRIARELSMRVALWSVDSGDTKGLSSGQIAASVLERVTAGAIVLLHDGGDRRPATLAACGEIVPALTSAGFQLVTISELLAGNGSEPAQPVG